MIVPQQSELQPSPSGIHAIPPELLDKIFLQLQPHPGTDVEAVNSLDPTIEPWTLTRVSRMWRTVAITQPTIWSDISVNLLALHYSGRPLPSVSALQIACKRSTPFPLYIAFTDCPSLGQSSLPEEILKVLVQHSERWIDVALNISFELFDILTEIRGRLPTLASLLLRPYGDPTFDIFDAFEVAPRLDVLRLKLDNLESYCLPIHQLRSITGPIEEPLTALQNASELEEVEIFFSFYRPPVPPPPIPLPTLRILVTNSACRAESLIVPNLQTLRIIPDMAGAHTSNHINQLSDFIQRNQCRLTTLIAFDVYWGIPADPEACLVLFRNLPELRVLELTEHYSITSWSVIAYQLTISETAENHLLPHLAQIRFTSRRRASQKAAELMKEMLGSRRRRSKQFSAEVINFWPEGFNHNDDA